MRVNKYTGLQDFYSGEKCIYKDEECSIVHHDSSTGFITLEKLNGFFHHGVHPNHCQKIIKYSSKILSTKIMERILEGNIKDNEITEMIMEHERLLIQDYKTEIDRFNLNNQIVPIEDTKHGLFCSALADMRNEFLHDYFKLSK